MQNQRSLGCKIFLLVIATLLAVTGCSRMNLAYRNLDLLIPWTLNDYLDMNRDQQQRFKSQLREHLSWHCRTQLPDYLAIVQQLQQQVTQGQLNGRALAAHYQKAKGAIDTIAVEITPSTVSLLRELSDDQVLEMFEALDKDNRKRRKKYLEPPLREQIRERAERMDERVQQWTGKISPAQRQRVLDWSQGLGDQNRLWLENRSQWQQAWRSAVAERNQDNFEQRVARLLQDRESFWTDEYRHAFARTEQAGIDLLSDLYAMLDADQRRHLNDRLQDIRNDLSSLECLQAQPAG